MDLKRMKSDPLLTKLFENEKHALLTLKGKHIVNAYDIFNQAPWIYVIAPLCNGGDLRKKILK